MASLVFINLFPVTLIMLGLLPSSIWLLVYLHEDLHPEPKRLILKIFLWGMLVAPLALIMQYLVISLAPIANLAATALVILVALAGIEEYLKYLVVKIEIEDEPDFNEPTDAMVYLIVSALGFAAVENVLIAFSLAPTGIAPGAGVNTANFVEATRVLGIRFLGATLLHAFSSGIVGYFLAKHFFGKKSMWIIPLGLLLATALHAFFNYLILESSEVRGTIIVPAAIAMIGVLFFLFKRLQKITAN